VQYHVKTLTATQRNWLIHVKELSIIVDCFRKWRDWLVGVNVNIYIYHQGLQYCNTEQKLNSRQAPWYLRMYKFTYQIYYQSGTKMAKPDILSRLLREEKFGIEAKFFEKGQLIVLEEDNVEKA